MDRDKTESKAQELYVKIGHWIEWQPRWQLGDPKWPDANKSGSTRIEIIKANGALDIRVEAPDKFSVRAPREEPKNMSEREMLDGVKRWLGFPDYPPSGSVG